MNDTNITAISQPYTLPQPLMVTIVAIQVLIIVAAVCGNVLVCVAICVNKNLRETASNYFIFSLAVSDILTASLSMPFDVDLILKPDWRWDHGPAVCHLWTTIYLIAVPTSILSLLAVSVDRYKAISDPLNKFRRSRFLTRKRATVVVIGLWTYSIVFALIPKMGWSLPQNQINFENYCVFNTPEIYSLLNSCLNFYLPLFIMVIIYFRIYKIANQMNCVLAEKSRESITNHTQKNKPTKAPCGKTSTTPSTEDGQQTPLCQESPDGCPVKKVKRQRRNFHRSVKTAKSILIIVCAFFFCWIPHTTMSVVSVFCKSCYSSIPGPVFPFILILGYLNSALNPPLYSLHNPKFVEALRKLLRLKNNKSRRAALSSFSPSDASSRFKTSLFIHSSRRSTGNKARTRSNIGNI